MSSISFFSIFLCTFIIVKVTLIELMYPYNYCSGLCSFVDEDQRNSVFQHWVVFRCNSTVLLVEHKCCAAFE